jgi:Glycosyl hydrolases family 38 N-terminal domain/Glycosyl hydrolases family 38 C-terminal domain
MTSRLLRASLGSPTYDGMRETLRTALHPVVAQVRGLTITAHPLPLFRRAEGKGLEQAVRVTVTAPAGAALDLELRTGDRTHDRATIELADGSATVDLFMPEVDAPVEAELVVGDGIARGTLTVTPQRKWQVHVVHHSHLDIGYTDRQGTVLRHHSEYLDSAVDLAEATGSWADDARFRWTVESALPLRRWLAGRATATTDRFLSLVRAGQIEVTAMPFQLHTEACSTEELHRLLRFTDDLREAHGIPITSAMHTDVPGAVAGLVDALAAAGVRYLSAAHNWAGRSVPFLVGGQQLGRPFWWRAPSGNRVLVWFTDTPHGMAYMEGNVVGLAEGYPPTLDLLPNYLDGLANRPVPYGREAFGWSGVGGGEVSKLPYPHDLLHLRVQGGPADNAGPSIIPATVIRRWNEAWAYPRLRSATNTDFFTAAERDLGDSLATHTGDWTDWWADGLGSGARPLGHSRRAQNAVRQAESLHTLAGDEATVAKIDEVYDRLGLFDEHTWGAANPWLDDEDGFDSGGLQWARKCELAYQAADDAQDLLADGARRLGAGHSPSADASFLVVNTGPGARTDVVEFFVPAATIPVDEPFTVVDSRSGETLAHHADLFEPEDEPTRPSGRRVRVRVDEVAAVGWVRLDLRRGGTHTKAEDLGRRTLLENEFYRVEYDLDDAVISSVFDKRAGRELVNTESPAGFNSYIRDTYSTAPHVNHLSGHIEALESDLSLLAGRTLGRRASVIKAERTAVGESLTVEMNGDGVEWIRATVTLNHGVPRVDIVNRIMKQGTPVKESVFFSFPLALADAPAAWELTGGVGGDAVPVVPGAARHMRPIRHWVGFADRELSVAWATLEAPLIMLGDLYLPYAPFPPTVVPEQAEPATVYSWALNNIWDTNFPGQQQGETVFRYAIASAEGSTPLALGPLAAAGLTDPLVAVPLTGRMAPDAGPTPPIRLGGVGPAAAPAEGLFARTSNELVHISSLGRSRRGHDLVVYLRSIADHDLEVDVTLPWPARAALLGTTLERDLTPVPVDGATARVTVPGGAHVALVLDARA